MFIALLRKDVRLHGRSVLATIALANGILYVAARLRDRGPSAAVGLELALNFFVANVWADWLVSREKTKGTIGWLRTLPLRDEVFVFAKFVAFAVASLLLWASTSMVFTGPFFYERPAAWFVAQAGLFCIGCLMVCIRLRFGAKLSQFLLPLILVGLFAIGRLAVEIAPGLFRLLYIFLTADIGLVCAGFLLIALSVCLGLVTAAWMRSVETCRLLE